MPMSASDAALLREHEALETGFRRLVETSRRRASMLRPTDAESTREPVAPHAPGEVDLVTAANPSEPQVVPCNHVVWLGSWGMRTLSASNCCRCHPEITIHEALANAHGVVDENPHSDVRFLHWSSNAEVDGVTDGASSWWSTL